MHATHPLDNPAWAALTGPHARLAERNGRAARYRPEVSAFIGLDDPADPAAWADLAALVGPGAEISIGGQRLTAPAGWAVRWHLAGVQMVLDAPPPAAADPEIVPLGPDDGAEMQDLVVRTEPGPFRPRAVEMGSYLGIRRDGRLVAMAGERLHPPGFVEVSAVCTDPAYRKQGLASRLTGAVAAGIAARGETPFLHAAASNTNAIRLYERLGFRLRRPSTFLALTVPG